jgi:hypothetical protein
MKNIFKVLAIIALVAVIGFSMSCGGGDDGITTNVPDTNVNDPSLSTLSGTVTISPSGTVVINTKLTATYNGSETVTLAYQWKNGSTNVGTNSNEYTPTAAGHYTVTVSATGYNPKTSNVVTVTIGGYSRETAIQLTANTWANGNISTENGEQWFKFTATTNTQYIHANAVTLTALFVQVYNSSNEPLVNEETTGYVNSYTGIKSFSLNVTVGQEYYIKVRREYYNYTGTYQIGFTSNFIPPAALLTANVLADGNLPYNSSVQWFKFTATASTQYIHTSFDTLTSMYIQLYDSNGVAVGSQTTLSGSTKNTSRTVTVGQEYYIKVSTGSSYNGMYQIAFNAMSFLTPNVTTLTANTWANGNLPTASDEQWFKFTATASTQYIHAGFGTLTSMDVQLYDSNGATVGSRTPLYSSTTYVSQSVTVGQEYYIKVSTFCSDYSVTYKIGFNATWYPPPGVITTLTAKVWADGNLPQYGEQWFKFTATASTQYIYAGFETLAKIYIQLYNSSGVAVGNSGELAASPVFGNTNSTSNTGLTVGQEYYIKVWPYGSDYSGTYKISFGTIGTGYDGATAYPFLTPPNTFTTLTLNTAVPYSPSTKTWYKFTATENGYYIVIRDGSGSVDIVVYDLNGFPLRVPIQLYNNSSSTRYDYWSGLTVGQEYYIWASAYSGGSGSQIKLSASSSW